MNAFDFANVIIDIIVYLQVITNSGTLYPLKTYHCCAILYASDALFLPYSIYKLAALLKSQIVVREIYPLSFQ